MPPLFWRARRERSRRSVCRRRRRARRLAASPVRTGSTWLAG